MLRFISAVLLVIGTAIGAGLLALPMATAHAGLYISMAFMATLWIVILVPSYYILELTIAHPKGAHLVTMAKNTLGIPGVIILWLSNCILLYSILCAYISAAGHVLFKFSSYYFYLPPWIYYVIFTAFFSIWVILGVRTTTVVNSIFMTLKGLLYFMLVIGMLLHMRPIQAEHQLFALDAAINTGVASFTFAMIIPTLYGYLDYNVKRLKSVIFIGTLISLCIYCLWLFAVHAVVPLHGDTGLYAATKKADVYLLAKTIGENTANPHILEWARGFVAVCLITTFLSISLVLSDVIADGLRIPKRGAHAVWIYALTYLPPLLIVIFIPRLFLVGINYAGLCAIIYIFILPCLMIYSARYVKKMIPPHSFAVFGHKTLVILATIVGCVLFILGLKNIF